jgi:hypothetical protein
MPTTEAPCRAARRAAAPRAGGEVEHTTAGTDRGELDQSGEHRLEPGVEDARVPLHARPARVLLGQHLRHRR